MHPAAKGAPSPELARANKLHQFFAKDTKPDHSIGTTTLSLKNVLMPGDQAPDFTADGYDGNSFKLSDFRGQFVLFDFWATWCGPCIAEIPNLEAVSEEFGGERFKVIGLSTDDNLDDPKAFLAKKPSSYLQGHVGLEESYTMLSTAYGIQMIPAIWLIDPNGKIIARDLRGDDIRTTVEQSLTAESE